VVTRQVHNRTTWVLNAAGAWEIVVDVNRVDRTAGEGPAAEGAGGEAMANPIGPSVPRPNPLDF
jgi:hypothetical protein